MILPGVTYQRYPILRSNILKIPYDSLQCTNFSSIFSDSFKRSLSLVMNRFLLPCEHVTGSDVADRTVKATIGVMIHELRDNPLCIFEARVQGPNRFFGAEGFANAR
jgi:hypothetical protein